MFKKPIFSSLSICWISIGQFSKRVRQSSKLVLVRLAHLLGSHFGKQKCKNIVSYCSKMQTCASNYGGKMQTCALDYGGKIQTCALDYYDRKMQTCASNYGGKMQTSALDYNGKMQTCALDYDEKIQTCALDYGTKL